jgi:fructose-1-phosphate kinase PfkB-like protein
LGEYPSTKKNTTGMGDGILTDLCVYWSRSSAFNALVRTGNTSAELNAFNQIIVRKLGIT